LATRILVIEDNAANMELMTYLLQAFGYATLTARDGKEGLEVAQRERPDLIVCDIQLPVMNGYEVARQIKADPALRDIPLVAVTAYAMVDDRQKTLAAGFDGYLTKPIAPETFVRQIEAFMRAGLRGTSALPSSETTMASHLASASGSTILIVDDKQVNLDLAVSLLRPSGYRVITANGMHEALALARGAPPDLIVSDVCMSDGSGYDFIREAKADATLRPIPFVFLTSTMTTEREREKGLALGAARFLFRPIEPRVLLDEIKACLHELGKR
jgi:two-component system, cell cycle response regulator